MPTVQSLHRCPSLPPGAEEESGGWAAPETPATLLGPPGTFCPTDLVYLFRLISRILWALVENRQSALFCKLFFRWIGGVVRAWGVGGNVWELAVSLVSLPAPPWAASQPGEGRVLGLLEDVEADCKPCLGPGLWSQDPGGEGGKG